MHVATHREEKDLRTIRSMSSELSTQYIIDVIKCLKNKGAAMRPKDVFSMIDHCPKVCLVNKALNTLVKWNLAEKSKNGRAVYYSLYEDRADRLLELSAIFADEIYDYKYSNSSLLTRLELKDNFGLA